MHKRFTLFYSNSNYANKTFFNSQWENTQMKKVCIHEKSTNHILHISASTVEFHEIMCNHESDNTQVQIKSFSAGKTDIWYLTVL